MTGVDGSHVASRSARFDPPQPAEGLALRPYVLERLDLITALISNVPDGSTVVLAGRSCRLDVVTRLRVEPTVAGWVSKLSRWSPTTS